MAILGKILELIIAQRLAFIANKYSVLPYNHFRGLKQKSTVDTLLVFQKKIYQAWKEKKFLLLITFDIKGAFSGIAIDVLIQQLPRRQCNDMST